MKVNPKLVIGLGNPGSKYAKTYHNVGFLAIDYLAKNPPISNSQLPITKTLKSDVFMNESGKFVRQQLKKHGLKPENLVIVHDDADIELGKYKLSFARNSAGHRGAQSIIDSLGTKDFWRLRIGIGKKMKAGLPAVARRAKAGEFVLKKITKSDLETLGKTFSEIKICPVVSPRLP